jgi:pilus assembly protein CpaF
MTRQAIFEASVGYFLDPIGEFLEDESVTEVMVNRYDQVYIERQGRLFPTDVRFDSEDALLSAVHNVAQWVGRRIDLEHPILDARLPDGSRVHAIIPPGCRAGTCLTIRKFRILGGLRAAAEKHHHFRRHRHGKNVIAGSGCHWHSRRRTDHRD